MKYGPAWSDRWQNEKIRGLSALGRHLFDYLCSNRATTSSGIYTLDLEAAGDETGIPGALLPAILQELATVHRRVNKGLRSPLVMWSGSTVWVVGMWKHALNRSANHKNAVGSDFCRAPRLAFWPLFFERYPDVLEHCLKAERFSSRETFARLWSGLDKDVDILEGQGLVEGLQLSKEGLAEGLKKCLPRDLIGGLEQGLRKGLTSTLAQRGEERELLRDSPPLSSPPQEIETTAPENLIDSIEIKVDNNLRPDELAFVSSDGGQAVILTNLEAAEMDEPIQDKQPPEREPDEPAAPADLEIETLEPREGLNPNGREIDRPATISETEERDNLINWLARHESPTIKDVRTYVSDLVQAHAGKLINRETFEGLAGLARDKLKNLEEATR
jgi:hypothetical protein